MSDDYQRGYDDGQRARSVEIEAAFQEFFTETYGMSIEDAAKEYGAKEEATNTPPTPPHRDIPLVEEVWWVIALIAVAALLWHYGIIPF